MNEELIAKIIESADNRPFDLELFTVMVEADKTKAEDLKRLKERLFSNSKFLKILEGLGGA